MKLFCGFCRRSKQVLDNIYHILSGGDGDGDENNYITVVSCKKKYTCLMVTNAIVEQTLSVEILKKIVNDRSSQHLIY